jgi:hypothetical protein
MPEVKEYISKLKKAEKVRELRDQRTTDSSQSRTRSSTSAHSLPPPQTANSCMITYIF